MKIASWNVNSLRVRLPQVLEWLETTEVDVLGLQETKVQDGDFPEQALNDAGYDVCYSGQKTYNGVALLARQSSVEKLGPLTEIVTDLNPSADSTWQDPQRRLLMATLGDWRVINVYVPNGSSVGSDKYAYKLTWLNHLRDQLEQELARHSNVVVIGDFNIAPSDDDVHDPSAWEGQVLVSAPEREALEQLLNLGLFDTFRHVKQEPASFSWWDYRAGGFARNRGVRIDLILAAQTLAPTLTRAVIDKTPRGWERPSDHAPTVAEFTL